MREAPLPTPSELSEYERLTPGLADRIVAMAEREQEQRITLARVQLASDVEHRDSLLEANIESERMQHGADTLGQWSGVAVALACIAAALVSVYMGAHPSVSIALVGVPALGIIKALRAK